MSCMWQPCIYLPTSVSVCVCPSVCLSIYCVCNLASATKLFTRFMKFRRGGVLYKKVVKQTWVCKNYLSCSQFHLRVEINFFYVLPIFDDQLGWNLIYCISRPVRRTFFPEKCDLIRPASYAPRVSIISKLINTRTSIIHFYREIVKTTMKMILVAVTTIFWVSVMNKLYYGC
jgi:hypothetical protein